MRKSCIVLVNFLILVSAANAQPDFRNTASHTNSWFMYFGNHKFSEQWGLHAEVQLRRSDLIANPQQVLLRTGVDYYSKGNVRWTLGYGFIQTYPYGEFPVSNDFPEHRIWQQLLVGQSIGKVKLSHRYRLEQRLIGNAATGKFADGRYENRMRYMAKATVNLTKTEKPVFLAVYDEIFLNFGEEVAFNLFDQNRLYGAVGFTFSQNLKLEVGYLNQRVQLRSLDISGPTPKFRIENNHTLQVGLFSTIAFVKK